MKNQGVLLVTTDEDKEEFTTEALELLEIAERALMEVENGEDFGVRFDAIFRSFHSIKGAAAMLEWHELSSFMHRIEDHFGRAKNFPQLSHSETTFFLKAIDHATQLLKGAESSFELEPSKTIDSPPPPIALLKSQPIKEKSKIDLLIVDDESEILEILGEIATRMKLSWRGYLSAQEALTDLSTVTTRIVISDYKMPDMTGLEFLKELRSRKFETPFILSSGYLTKENILEATELGATGFMEKPLKEAYVVSQIHQATLKAEQDDLINKTLNLILYQIPEIDAFLASINKGHHATYLREEIIKIIAKRGELRRFKISA